MMRPMLALCVLWACNADGDGRTTGFGGSITSVGSTVGTSGDGSGTTASETTTSGDPASSGVADTSSTDASSATGDGWSSGGDGTTTGGGGFNCPPVAPLDCSPGPGSGKNDTCTLPGSCFLDTVQNAVNGVIDGYPQWFDLTDGQPFVLDVEGYMNQVVADVAATGLCAIRDPNAGDEIAVKHDNEYAENFDILTAEGYARYGDGIYTSTCAPAWF